MDVANEIKRAGTFEFQLGYPNKNSFQEGYKMIQFKYREQIFSKDRVFKADEVPAAARKFVVKFCQTYSEAVHRLLAGNGFAPKLYGIEVLPGGWLMVVMEEIEGAVRWDSNSHPAVNELKLQLQEVLEACKELNTSMVT